MWVVKACFVSFLLKLAAPFTACVLGALLQGTAPGQAER